MKINAVMNYIYYKTVKDTYFPNLFLGLSPEEQCWEVVFFIALLFIDYASFYWLNNN